MNRKLILLPLFLAACSLVLVGAGNERTKTSAGAEDALSLEQRQTDQAIAPVLKPAELEVVPHGAASSLPPNINLDWYSVNGGGDNSVSSASYSLGLSVGQAAAGKANGATFNLGIGFWYGAAGAGGSCPIAMTGDVNVSGTLTSADIIYMVNFVFKGGPDPLPCSATADVNCSGSVTSADVIYMVNHVFKGGIAPCDACTSPLAAGC
jgi:hypothetical protein